MLSYKEYIGVFEFEEGSNLFRGKVSNIDDLVTFQGKSKKEVEEAFRDAVDDYIAWCKKYRQDPKQRPTATKKTRPS